MEKNMGLLVFLVVVSVFVSIVGWAVIGSHQVDQEALSKDVTAQVIAGLPVAEPVVVPTAAEIAALVVIPTVDVPEFESDSKVLDLWENQYSVEIDELEAEAYDVAELELEDHDYKLLVKYLEASIVGFDELKNVDVEDYEVTIVELGLEEDEDKVAEIEFDLKVKYVLEEGATERLKKNILLTATVSFDEGDYTDSDVELIFN